MLSAGSTKFPSGHEYDIGNIRKAMESAGFEKITSNYFNPNGCEVRW